MINEEISTDLLQIVYWSKSKRNKLPINFDKITYMLIRARKRLSDTDNLELNVVETSTKQDLLYLDLYVLGDDALIS